ncbi:hypothetical protein BH18ACI4_BH18ACI4_08010 [soil metagenome]
MSETINLGNEISPAKHSQATPLFSSDDLRSIYSADPNDSWNRIFQLLFTRTVKAHLSSEFKEGAPFTRAEGMGIPALRISARVFAQNEIGDRAIEPLYPSFFNASGALQVLTEPRYSQLKRALADALNEVPLRPPIARALMQRDAWADYDILFETHDSGGDKDKEIGGKKEEMLWLLARFTRKLALTPQEIESLPNNYSAAITAKILPNLFTMRNGWMEIQLLPERLHDRSSKFRRASRVFIKPRGTDQNQTNFLESLKGNLDMASKVEAVALAVQDLLIDSNGKVVPSPVINKVQFRNFFTDQKAALSTAEIRHYEMSRRLLLTNPSTGGFVEFDEKSPAYLAVAGNDYDFATSSSPEGSPVMIRLRTRCTQCHGESLVHLMTFSVHDVPPLPPVTVFKPGNNERALLVAGRKQERADFRSLRQQMMPSLPFLLMVENRSEDSSSSSP